VLGAANIAVARTIPAARGVACARILGLASRDGERARQAADELGVERAYGSYEALLDDPDIDAVYIPLPNAMHLEWCVRAMEAGKAVLCEKPLALLPDDVRTIQSARDRTGMHIEEAFVFRNHPQWYKMDALIRSDAIGRVIAANGVLAKRFMDPDDIRNSPQLGGGGTYDLGSYAIAGFNSLFGRAPLRVIATMEADPIFTIDRLTSAILDYGDAQATLTVSTQGGAGAWATHQHLSVLGTHGWMRADFPYAQARPTESHLFLGGVESFGNFETEKFTFPPVNQYGLQIERFSKVLLGEPAPVWPVEDALLTLTVIQALFESARSGEWRPIAI
jgi:predicted dehydrogenase